jgi:hypothetical protein
MSRRLVSKYGLGLDAEAMDGVSETFLLHLALGDQQGTEMQAATLRHRRRAAAVPASPQLRTRFVARRSVSLDDVTHQPSPLERLINSLDTSCFTKWPAVPTTQSGPTTALKQPTKSSRENDKSVRRSTLLKPTKAYEMHAALAIEQRRRLQGSQNRHLREAWKESALAFLEQPAVAGRPSRPQKAPYQLPAISKAEKAKNANLSPSTS